MNRGTTAGCGVRATLLALALGLVSCPPLACAEAWHSAQPPPPPPLEGQSGIGVPVPLGHVGQISFWAPNKGLLITSGNEAVSAGLYSYNGISWRELSTVCGGADGRIAWAGPDDFWTISDQQTGQQLGKGSSPFESHDRSLCHFENGRVVASYAEPVGVAESYEAMDAAACSGPDDCWFGGERLPADGVNVGAFHLHWNGQILAATPSLQTPEAQLEDPGHAIADIEAFNGSFYESAQVQEGDRPTPSESAAQPFLLHRIVEGSSKPFEPLVPLGPLVEHPKVVGEREPFAYGVAGVSPVELSAFVFSGDSAGMWAIAGPLGGNARVTALLMRGSAFEQLNLTDPSGALPISYEVAGVAAEPGTEDAWVSVDPPNETSPRALARVVRIHADGEVDPAEELPLAGEEIGHKGVAEAIACPAQGDCWMATSGGWLFHLGGQEQPDEDPDFQGLITYRPPDASIPFVAAETFPEDDSGANPPPIPPPPVASATGGTRKVHVPLFSHARARLVNRTTLALTFTLATKSRVRLRALRDKRQVAQTRLYVLSHGRHTLELRLSPRAWPTKLDLRVRAIGSVPLVATGSDEGTASGGPTVVGTSYHGPFSPLLRNLAQTP